MSSCVTITVGRSWLVLPVGPSWRNGSTKDCTETESRVALRGVHTVKNKCKFVQEYYFPKRVRFCSVFFDRRVYGFIKEPLNL